MSDRDVEALLAERGIAGSDETSRRWGRRCGPTFAAARRRRRPRLGDRWPRDDVQRALKGRRLGRWRAGEQHGVVLDRLVQRRRHPAAAEAGVRRLVAGQGSQPRGVSTDTLARSPPARRRVLARAAHRRH